MTRNAVKKPMFFCARCFFTGAAAILWLASAAQLKSLTVNSIEFLKIVDTSASVEKIAGGYGFLEGPVWSNKGYLLFSDLPANKIFKLVPGSAPTIFLDHSGYDGQHSTDMSNDYGSDALAYDQAGNLLVCQHGNHAIAMLSRDGKLHTLVNSYEGSRLNSPDDLAIKSDGSIYFTDPPYIFPKLDKDTAKKQKNNGVYRYQDGRLTLLLTDYRYPNGLCFSPDEKYLYVCSYGNNEPVRRYDVSPNGLLHNGKLFYNDNGDGLKSDCNGDIYLCNNKGISVISPAGTLLGMIHCPEPVTNINWGDNDRKTLYIVAHTGVYKVRLQVHG